MNPAAIAADIVKLAAAHPTIAQLVVDVIQAALNRKNPWRSVIRKMIRVASEHASDELADEMATWVNARTPPEVK